MRDRSSGKAVTVGIAAAATIVAVSVGPSAAQTPAPGAAASTSGAALKTAWGEPDLQGIWTDEFDTPFQRPAKYANQEFFTAEQRAEIDRERTELLGRRATDRDFAGAYNLAAFTTTKHTGPRTSRIVDPPNGRLPAPTADAQKAFGADRE